MQKRKLLDVISTTLKETQRLHLQTNASNYDRHLSSIGFRWVRDRVSHCKQLTPCGIPRGVCRWKMTDSHATHMVGD